MANILDDVTADDVSPAANGTIGDGETAPMEAEPAAPPSPAPATGDVYVTIARGGLNLRAGPGTEFAVIGNLALGTRVHLLKREGMWGQVDQNGDGAADGHVLLSYLRPEQADGSPSQPAQPSSPSSGFITLDKVLLQTIMDRCGGIRIKSRLDLNVVSDALNRAMLLADADTRLREVAFLSQAVIETDYFRTFEEYGKGQGKPYGRYYGRGMHQLTWEGTYASCSTAVFGDNRLVADPDLIIKDIGTNIQATAWYWRDYKPFNALADARNIDEIIRRLYGGTISSPDPKVRQSVILRRSFYTTIKSILDSQ
ncbi:SH3 domain-containing protein [Mesorhizobium carmichaelinearum]|uniref:SH3 domain-containing protein n=1 Tax=Mesorhizobium carmichaelinearum TaxID=1208188 RepID=UPI000BA3D162|nr:SH3 domain-containing protein [Mesorhizobium carmichaelinearum]